MPSLGLKAVRAPERITRLSSVHLAALNKVHLCGIWRRDCLPFALFARSLHTMEATTRSDKCPIRLCCLAGSWQSRWWERTASVGSCPSAAAGSASSVAQMLGGWGVGGGITCNSNILSTACLPSHLWRYAGMVDASPQSRRGLLWVWVVRWLHLSDV